MFRIINLFYFQADFQKIEKKNSGTNFAKERFAYEKVWLEFTFQKYSTVEVINMFKYSSEKKVKCDNLLSHNNDCVWAPKWNANWISHKNRVVCVLKHEKE